MIKLQFDASLIRAAMACQAKNDLRYYHKGICITTTGDVVGTDGRLLFCGSQNWEGCDTLKNDIILSIDGKIPLGATTVTVYLPDIDPGTSGTVRTDNNKLFPCNIIDGRFPDYKQVIPPRLSESGSYTNVLTFNADLLARIPAVFGKGAPVAVYTRDRHSSIRVECPEHPDWVFVVMPVRLDVDDALLLKETPIGDDTD